MRVVMCAALMAATAVLVTAARAQPSEDRRLCLGGTDVSRDQRLGYFKRLKESVLQHLHIHEKSQPGETGSKPGQVHSSEPPR